LCEPKILEEVLGSLSKDHLHLKEQLSIAFSGMWTLEQAGKSEEVDKTIQEAIKNP